MPDLLSPRKFNTRDMAYRRRLARTSLRGSSLRKCNGGLDCHRRTRTRTHTHDRTHNHHSGSGRMGLASLLGHSLAPLE
jgi:hypothetical protein